MGNRALIAIHPAKKTSPCIYVHWSGGRESIEGFLMAAKALGMRSPEDDPSYALARLTQLIGNFFGGEPDGYLSLGLGLVGDFALEDNGLWEIGGEWKIIRNKQYPQLEAYDIPLSIRTAKQAVYAMNLDEDDEPKVLDRLDDLLDEYLQYT